MAVTEAEPHIKAHVCVNGVPLQEYDNDEGERASNTVTKYVEATTGARFTVGYEFLPGFNFKHDMRVVLYVDGKRLTGKILESEYKERWLNEPLKMSQASERAGNQRYVRDFVFSQLSTSDSTHCAVANDSLLKKLKSIGLITLKFSWVEIISKYEKGSYAPPEIAKIDEIIPEKALKGRALSNQVTLGERKPARNHQRFYFKTVPIDEANEFFVTINFMYRSKKDLQSLLIIPRDASPVPLEERDIDTLSQEELRELVRRQKESKEAASRVKIEHGVKRERSPAGPITITDEDGDGDEDVSFVSSKRCKYKSTANAQGVETIDLT